MSSYEFWDELGKIFNAVVAYQEKNIEFNKRFISPWIRLGNVFEKQDRNKEAVEAYERAIEIDGENPRNWFELGNIHFKMENHPDAIGAFNRAIELDGGFGLAYSNLALTLATTGKVEQAIELYEKAIELLQDPKDRAVAWNRLGNAYRKLNQYEQALKAFHKADELDRDNAGFRDSMDDMSNAQVAAAVTGSPSETGHALEETVEGSRAEEAEASTAGSESELEAAAETGDEEAPRSGFTQPVAAEEAAEAPASELPEHDPGAAPSTEDTSVAAATASGDGASDARAGGSEETVTVVVQDTAETFTETLPMMEAAPEAGDANLKTNPVEPDAADAGTSSRDVVMSEETELTEDAEDAVFNPDDADFAPASEPREPEPLAESLKAVADIDPAPNSLADQLLDEEPGVLDVPQHVAYEEYLKDTNEAVRGVEGSEPAEVEAPGPEPTAKLDETGELQIEMDTKNAHVWNELGNVYFNSSAYDDAIVAYSKAIELDRWFAWPYSNLALAYVQKRRFVEAILLYQRSIELFTGEKDKAISWNRLGNVYRRLNDYENAIAAYQRADALDPDNSTLSMQSRFSLLGSYAMDQKPSYVS